MSTPTAVIAAIATPPGRGGIGVVRVSGPDVTSIIAGILGRTLRPRHATLATFRGAQGEALDRGLAIYYPMPSSYTGEAMLELQGHGGPAVLALLLKRCLDLGASLAAPGEFTKRAFLNGKIDLVQAEGVADLIDAATATAARAAARSLTGAFSDEIQQLVEALVELRMVAEATLDFPEEEVEFLRVADAVDKLRQLRERLDHLLARSRQGRLLRDGLNVVLVGQPNVGKSSLLNRLAGEEIAIVTPVPGTTRDAIRESIDIGGIPLHIVDTAGMRDSTDMVERVGIERAWSAVAKADLAVVVTDAREADHAADHAIISRLAPALPRIVIRNKIDLCGGAVHADVQPGQTEIWVSAKTGAGMDLLRDAMLAAAGVHEDMEGTFLARERHLRALTIASDHLAAASPLLAQAPLPLELFAEELRLAQQSLGVITGEVSADDLLGVIFSRFCIGK